MDIKDIIAALGIDPNDADAVDGATQALNALKTGEEVWPPPPPPPPTDPPLPPPPKPKGKELGDPDDDDGDEDDRQGGSAGKTDAPKMPKDGLKNQEQKLRRRRHKRTILAAERHLEKAKQANADPDKIQELERAIAALKAYDDTLSEDASKKSIFDLSVEEHDQLIDNALRAILALGGDARGEIKVETDEEHKAKVKAFNDIISDDRVRTELEIEDSIQVSADRERELERQQNLARQQRLQNAPRRLDPDSFAGFKEFLDSLKNSLATQVRYKEKTGDTWSAINRRYNGTGVLKQGQNRQRIPSPVVPVIDFYFDWSGSWGAADIKVGQKAVDAALELERQGLIKVNLYYFGANVSPVASSVDRGSTTAWNEIVKTIKETRATNVVIMTDSDMQNYGNARHTVRGIVWYLWKCGSNAQRLPQDLQGEFGTKQFSFDTSDYK